MGTDEIFRVTLKGPGLSLDRAVSAGVVNRVISLILGADGRTDAIGPTAPGATEHPRDEAEGAETPRHFMTVKSPLTEMERVTCLAYYLYRDRRKSKFKTKDLTDLNREAAQPALANASFAARNAATRGYLAPVGGGYKQITTMGEALVNALPDRDNIQSALKTFRKHNRRRGKRTRVAT